MPPVVPFQRHDAAAGAQVCGFLAAFRLTEACQQQRIRAEPVLRGAVDHSSIIQNFRRMFHRQCAVSLPKNAGYFPAEFVHETKSGAAAQHFVQYLFCGGRLENIFDFAGRSDFTL